jgi:tail assembly chaperone E/41/14-like protein
MPAEMARKENLREGFQKPDENPVSVVKSPEQPAPVETPIEEPEWPLTIPLIHKQVQKKPGEFVKELVFREPTAGDLMRAGGNPCRVEVIEISGGNITWQPIIDDAKMIRLMASLCGVLEPFLMQMDTRDYNSCSHRLRRFFLPEQGIW